MRSGTVLNSVEMAVLHEAFNIAVDTLKERDKLEHPRADVVAKLIKEIGERRVRAGVALAVEEDAKSVASFATAILTKSDPR